MDLKPLARWQAFKSSTVNDDSAVSVPHVAL